MDVVYTDNRRYMWEDQGDLSKRVVVVAPDGINKHERQESRDGGDAQSPTTVHAGCDRIDCGRSGRDGTLIASPGIAFRIGAYLHSQAWLGWNVRQSTKRASP